MPLRQLKLIGFFIVFFVIGLCTSLKSVVYAASSSDSCLGSYGINYVGAEIASSYRTDTTEVPFSITGPNFISGNTYQLFVGYEKSGSNPIEVVDSQVANNGKISFTLRGPNTFSISGDGNVLTRKNKTVYIGENGNPFCTLKKYSVKTAVKCTFSFDQVIENTGCIDEAGGKVTARITDIASATGVYSGPLYLRVKYSATWGLDGYSDLYTLTTSPPGSVQQSFDVFKNRTFVLSVEIPHVGICESSKKTVVQICSDEARKNGKNLGETIDPDKVSESPPFKLCDQITDSTLKDRCIACAGADDQDAAGIWTAVGCIKREPTALISALIQIGLSIAGGITLLVILAAGFMLTTSQGDPKRAGEAKEMITAAVMGILFIIFSVTILQFIGYNVLKIPGFGG